MGKVNLELEPLDKNSQERKDTLTYRKFVGADLVVIRELMDILAEQSSPKWGGLTRRTTQEGDILWLCKEHLREYENKRKPVPPPLEVPDFSGFPELPDNLPEDS